MEKHAARTKRSVIQLLKKEGLAVVLMFLVWRTALFGIGSLADTFLSYLPTFPYAETLLTKYDLPRWLYSWANFDGVHYLTIAEKGYVGTGLIQAFFPLFPHLILRTLFLLSQGTLNTLAAGLVISNLFALVAVLAWYGFLRELYDQRKALLGVSILLLFPTSLFFGALYTEALFFLCAVGSFWAARRQVWWAASLFTLAAAATRIVGIFLVPALLIELWQQHTVGQAKKTVPQLLSSFIRSRVSHILLISLGWLGLIGYMIYLQLTFGDALYFLHVQSEFGAGRQEGIVLYPQVLWRSIKILLTVEPNSWRYYTVVLEFLAGSLGLAGLAYAGWHALRGGVIRVSYVIFALGAFLLPTLTGTFSSMPRYIMICFPLYLILIEWTADRAWARAALFMIFTLGLLINTVLFIQGYWLS